MLVSFVYLVACRLFALVLLLARSDRSKELELLVCPNPSTFDARPTTPSGWTKTTPPALTPRPPTTRACLSGFASTVGSAAVATAR